MNRLALACIVVLSFSALIGCARVEQALPEEAQSGLQKAREAKSTVDRAATAKVDSERLAAEIRKTKKFSKEARSFVERCLADPQTVVQVAAIPVLKEAAIHDAEARQEAMSALGKKAATAGGAELAVWREALRSATADVAAAAGPAAEAAKKKAGELWQEAKTAAGPALDQAKRAGKEAVNTAQDAAQAAKIAAEQGKQ